MDQPKVQPRKTHRPIENQVFLSDSPPQGSDTRLVCDLGDCWLKYPWVTCKEKADLVGL